MNISNKIQSFLELSPLKYRFLEAFSLNSSVKKYSASDYQIEMTLINIEGEEIDAINIKFFNAVDIKIGDLNNIYAMQIEIDDISSNQLEGLKFRVTEQENCGFSFSCEDFLVTRLRNGKE